jgi:hypothetical protein
MSAVRERSETKPRGKNQLVLGRGAFPTLVLHCTGLIAETARTATAATIRTAAATARAVVATVRSNLRLVLVVEFDW